MMCGSATFTARTQHKNMRTCPGSLYQSSSCSRSGWAFLRLISAMTSKTSESELLEQVLSSSDSHSDSLELSNTGQGKNREDEEIHNCLFFQQTSGCLPHTKHSAKPMDYENIIMKIIEPMVLSHNLVMEKMKTVSEKHLMNNTRDNANHSGSVDSHI